MIKELSFVRLSALAKEWLLQGGLPRVELAAMEPTLWQEGSHTFQDVISLFADMGYQVNITTNGSTLDQYAEDLAKLPIGKIRISWHTLDPQAYKKMTGGDYEIFLKGIHSCVEHGLPVCYNRVLFKGLTEDIARHIEIIDLQKARIKFLELYVTKHNSPFFGKYHLNSEEFLRMANQHPLLKRDETFLPNHAARSRHVWITPKGGRVEFKIAETCTKTVVCQSCPFSADCIEGFAEYFRVLPDGRAALCYLRNDFDVQLFKNDLPIFFETKRLLEIAGIDFDRWVKHRSLRLILTSRCNYNCTLPEGEATFCLGKRFRSM